MEGSMGIMACCAVLIVSLCLFNIVDKVADTYLESKNINCSEATNEE